MANMFSGLVGVVLVLGFLGFYAVGIHALSFTIIVVGVGAMIVMEFVQSLRNDKQRG